MGDSSINLQQIILAALKVCTALVYLILGMVYIPRIDAATSRRKMTVVKTLFSGFIGFSILTYLHIAWFIYMNLMPNIYYVNPIYKIGVATHAALGIILVILMYPLVSLRVVDDKSYSDFIDRQILIEKQRLLAEMQESDFEAISDEALSTYDMAQLILKAYKG